MLVVVGVVLVVVGAVLAALSLYFSDLFKSFTSHVGWTPGPPLQFSGTL